MKQVIFASTLSLFILGCSIKHPVADDYKQYLKNNTGERPLVKQGYQADYTLSEKTINHHYEFRSGLTGYANLWIIDFGKLLEDTLESKDVQRAFISFKKKQDHNASKGILIEYNLISYEFKNLEARVELEVTLYNNSKFIFSKAYQEKGVSQGGKMFWGGAFGMKNAIQQSTKSAIDKILQESFNDIMKKK